MYKQLFGLTKDPFGLSPDPSFLYLTDQHREALSGLTLGILQRKGLLVLSGEVGTGKTTLLSRVLQFLPPSRLQFSMILNPSLTPSEFLELTLLNFGVTDVPPSKLQRLIRLLSLIQLGRSEGKVTVLVVDEAHLLSPEVFEELRMLGNLEEPEDRFLQVVLVGQLELDQILMRDYMGQFKQRIGSRLTLRPLASTEVGDYIQHRWWRAGGAELPFTPEAIELIGRASRRVPRLINSLCDNALIAALAEQSTWVHGHHVRVATADLNLCDEPDEELAMESAQPAPILEAPSFVTVTEPSSSRWGRLIGRILPGPRRESTTS